MSDQAPPPIPHEDTPWLQQRINLPIVAGFLLSVLSLVPDIAGYVLPFVPPGQRRDILLAGVGICGLIAARFGRTATQNLANATLPGAAREEKAIQREAQKALGFTGTIASDRPVDPETHLPWPGRDK